MSSHKTTFNFNRTAAHPNELGVNYDGDGVNFALFSEVAARIELCLFDEAGNEEIWRGDLSDMARGVFGTVICLKRSPVSFMVTVFMVHMILKLDIVVIMIHFEQTGHQVTTHTCHSH